jgi:hypothetical protein
MTRTSFCAYSSLRVCLCKLFNYFSSLFGWKDDEISLPNIHGFEVASARNAGCANAQFGELLQTVRDHAAFSTLLGILLSAKKL